MARRGDITRGAPAAAGTGKDFARFLRSTHAPAHSRRTAENCAAFFLPHLTAGMSLLDLGCGPGSITLGLAHRTSPGETIGVDNDQEVLEQARANTTSGGPANLRFEHADATALPFPDATFDAVFMHALLQHLAEPALAIAEARRVLKPGGVIAVRDADHDGSIIFPGDPILLRSLAVMTEFREVRHTSPRVGKQVRSLLVENGFEYVVASVTADCDGTEQAVRSVGEANARYWSAEPFVQEVQATGLATAVEIDSFSAAWSRWSQTRGAFWARFWCEAVGWLPRNS